ncbi:iron-sulfur cluster assembly protein 1-like [Phoenix dactylifera]|uniref:Iron-sulfur cluster assembly protein n=1 Tax=Phoenix dactylifera TaxID=42345 RepID=A0A8B7D3V5_PHODC|nr:iron-sulfur cluster assembly protein 1-like [Phoenix dactylifera]
MLRVGAKRLLGLGLGHRAPALPGAAAGSGAAAVVVRGYHERVVDHYNNPRNVGSFDKNDPNVGTGLVGAPACGDVMKLQIKVDKESGKIVDACFKTFGCGSAIASSSVATEWVKGKPMEEVLSIKNTEIAKHLSLPPVKLHCSMLAEDAIKAAIKDYEAKKTRMAQQDSESVPDEKAADA